MVGGVYRLILCARGVAFGALRRPGFEVGSVGVWG